LRSIQAGSNLAPTSYNCPEGVPSRRPSGKIEDLAQDTIGSNHSFAD
jgi:hypothetical protein